VDIKRKNKNTYIARFITSEILCLALQPIPSYATWEYSLAAQIAFLDGLQSTCKNVEPQLNTTLNKEWTSLVAANGKKAIDSARKSQEYFSVYRMVLYEHLKHGWGDIDEEAHLCEGVLLQLNNHEKNISPWWRDRLCVDVPLNSEEGHRCGEGPSASVSLVNSMTDKEISILRVVPSSDVSFPKAGTYVHLSDSSDKLIPADRVPGAWSIPGSVEFEWKEWPQTFPGEARSADDLKKVRSYVDNVRTSVQRKRTLVVLRDHIPRQAIADVLKSQQTAEPGQEAQKSMKLFFIFMNDGLRFRWEQWRGECIEKYGGDQIDLPRDRLLSSSHVCSEPDPKS
jgi:hypothetical protein